MFIELYIVVPTTKVPENTGNADVVKDRYPEYQSRQLNHPTTNRINKLIENDRYRIFQIDFLGLPPRAKALL